MSYPNTESDWNDYQEFVHKNSLMSFDKLSPKEMLAVLTLGLSGEVSETVKEVNDFPINDTEIQITILKLCVSLGITTGDLTEKIKKHLRDNTQVNNRNLTLELGDVMAYIALIGAVFNIDLAEIMKQNEYKLANRFGTVWKATQNKETE